MKQVARTGVSLGAILSASASMFCCLPLGAALAAAGIAGSSAFARVLRPWMLALSVLLLGAGFWQKRRARQCGLHRSKLNDAMLWIAAAVVLAMILFPQEIAGLIADHLVRGRSG